MTNNKYSAVIMHNRMMDAIQELRRKEPQPPCEDEDDNDDCDYSYIEEAEAREREYWDNKVYDASLLYLSVNNLNPHAQ